MRLQQLHILPWYRKEKQLAQDPLGVLSGTPGSHGLRIVRRIDKRLDSSM